MVLCAAPPGVPRGALWFGELLSLHQSWRARHSPPHMRARSPVHSSRPLALALRRDLFAPSPNREDGYWVVVGQRVEGDLFDVVGGGPLTFARPELPSAWYGGSRWLQYYLRLWEEARKPKRSQNTAIFSAMVQWHCGRLGPDVARVALVFVREARATTRTRACCPNTSATPTGPSPLAQVTPLPGQPAAEEERLQVWQEDCAGAAATLAAAGSAQWQHAAGARAHGEGARARVPSEDGASAEQERADSGEIHVDADAAAAEVHGTEDV